MSIRLFLCWLRIAATVVVALGMLASAQAGVTMRTSGRLTAVEICHKGSVITVYMDQYGNQHPVQHDCQDCDLCNQTPPSLTAFVAGNPLQAHAVCVGSFSARDFVVPRPDYLTPPLRGPSLTHNRIAKA